MKKSKRTLTPKLRFPEFRDGEGWQPPQLSDLYGFKRTNTLSRDKLNYEAGTIRNIHYGDIHTKFKPLFRVNHEYVPFINPEVSVDAFAEEDDCEEGDIVLADASEDLNDVGKAIEVVSLDGQRVVSGTHTILATRHGSVPIVGFGGHLFQSAAVRAGIQRESQGAKVYGISANRISPVALPLPPTNQEQQKIAECLSSLDGLIAAEGRTLEALKAHKKGLMQEFFPQPGQTQPRLRFPEFRDKGEWEEKPLGELAKFASGGTPSKTDPKFWDGDIPWISASAMHDTAVYDSELRVTQEAIRNGASLAAKGSILILVRGSMLFKRVPICIAERDVAFNQDVKSIRPKRGVVTRYLLNHLIASESRIAINATGIGAGKIDANHLKSLAIGVPSSAEQQKIAACLTALDTQIAAQAAKLDALKQHKRGLMQQLFPSPEEVEA